MEKRGHRHSYAKSRCPLKRTHLFYFLSDFCVNFLDESMFTDIFTRTKNS